MILTLYNSRWPTCSLIISIGVGCEKNRSSASCKYYICYLLGIRAFFVQPQLFRFLRLHLLCVYCVTASLLLYSLSPVFEPLVCLFLSVLDRPVVCGSSGLLLFSCFLRYPSHCFAAPSSNFKPSPLCFHTLVPDLELAPSGFPNKHKSTSLVCHSVQICPNPCMRSPPLPLEIK